jgi:hypothetical protein
MSSTRYVVSLWIYIFGIRELLFADQIKSWAAASFLVSSSYSDQNFQK